jgi:hypothetical protein
LPETKQLLATVRSLSTKQVFENMLVLKIVLRWNMGMLQEINSM